ncbi:uncharacterized protein METZ01_LOCUS241433 [marine metagenome]|uniref:Uncharacterized protein n=1 Tax=marine metagenome TaxID=408172 RepID=A0A382HN08_9ZZZZ
MELNDLKDRYTSAVKKYSELKRYL